MLGRLNRKRDGRDIQYAWGSDKYAYKIGLNSLWAYMTLEIKAQMEGKYKRERYRNKYEETK
jgi:hypothetical protein